MHETVSSRAQFVSKALAMALATSAALAVASVAAADDPPDPATFSGMIRVSDQTTPPTGWYPGGDDFIPHPTVYVTLSDRERDYPLGYLLPVQGLDSFEAMISISDESVPVHLRPSAVTLVPGAKWSSDGTPAGYWVGSPYFTYTGSATCESGGVCSPIFDAELYSKWGNVEGTVFLVDGSPLPGPLSVGAAPAVPTDVPSNGAHLFLPRTASTGADGKFTFVSLYMGPEEPCPTCAWIAVDPQNNWGLRVLGDGGEHNGDPLIYSNKAGHFNWRIKLDKYHWRDVDVTSGTASSIQWWLTKDEYYEDARDQEENRPDECSAQADHPVSLITGNVLLDQTDVSLPGVLENLVFTRSYNSLTRLEGSFGKGWNHAFESRVEVLSPTLIRLWAGNGGPRYFSDPDGDGAFSVFATTSREKFTQTADGFRHALGDGTVDEYNTDGRLVGRTDRAGRRTVVTLDADGKAIAITSPEGRSLTLTYELGVVRSLNGPAGVIAEYRYEFHSGGHELIRVRYADGTGYRFTYNDARQLTTVSDLGGVVLDRHGYDGDRVVWSELSGGRERRSYEYGDGFTTVTDAAGAVSVFEWTKKPAGRFVTKVTGTSFCEAGFFCEAGSGTYTWERDDWGRITKRTGPDGQLTGKSTTYQYAGDDLVRVTDPEGRVTAYAGHDEYGRPGTVTETGWGTTTLTWLPEGIHTVRLPGGQTTEFTYENHALHTVRTGEGATYTLGRNAKGEVTSLVDPRSKTTTFTYDLMGRLATITRPGQLTTKFAQDARGRLLSRERPDGKRQMYQYDDSGRLTAVTDEAGQIWRYSYDGAGRLASGVDPLGNATQLRYDVMSRVTSVTDAKGQTTSFEYDDLGRLRHRTDPMSGVEDYDYYPSGRLKTRTDRAGVQATFTYDGVGRLLSASYSDGTPGLNIVYEDAARKMTLGNGTDTVTLTYDESGRLSSETSTFNGSSVTYTHNADHQPLTVSLDGDLVTEYTYESGLLDTLTFGKGVLQFDYDDLGRRTQLTYPNGIVTTYAYDPKLPLLESIRAVLGGSEVMRADYTHDSVGNRVTKTNLDWTEGYDYDVAGRLTASTRTGAAPRAWRFGYDAVGNRTSVVIDGIGRSLSFDRRNRLLSDGAAGIVHVAGTTSEPASVTVQGQTAQTLTANEFGLDTPIVPGESTITVAAQDASGNLRTSTYDIGTMPGEVTYAYDANGNVTTKTEGTTTWAYEWNARGQLTTVTKDGQDVARYRYDPLGRRVEKVAGGVTTRYVYAGTDVLRETQVGGGSILYAHGLGIDEPLAGNRGQDGVAYYHADGLGSIVATTDAAGNVTSRRQYDAWGNLEVGADQPGYAFTGREWDPEIGLYYYRARYYDPEIGRFISEDPIGFRGGADFYAYVGNSPVHRVDPSGLQWAPRKISPNFILVPPESFHYFKVTVALPIGPYGASAAGSFIVHEERVSLSIAPGVGAGFWGSFGGGKVCSADGSKMNRYEMEDTINGIAVTGSVVGITGPGINYSLPSGDYTKELNVGFGAFLGLSFTIQLPYHGGPR